MLSFVGLPSLLPLLHSYDSYVRPMFGMDATWISGFMLWIHMLDMGCHSCLFIQMYISALMELRLQFSQCNLNISVLDYRYC